MYCGIGGLCQWKKLHQKDYPIDTASRFDGTFGADSGNTATLRKRAPAPVIQALTVLFLVSVFAQAFLTLVGGNFVTFAFFSARHTIRVMSEELLLDGFEVLGWRLPEF